MKAKGRRTVLVTAALAAAVVAWAGWSLREVFLESWLSFRLERMGAGDETEIREIARRLREIGSPAALGPLLGLLENTDRGGGEWIRSEIAAAARAAGPRAAPSLERFLDEGDHDHSLRSWAAIRLFELRPESAAARTAILETVVPRSGPVTVAGLSALHVIEESGIDPMPFIIEVLRRAPQGGIWACGRLEEIGPPAREALPALLEALKGGDRALRIAAAAALAEIAGARSGVLETLLDGLEAPETRPAALRGIGNLREEGLAALPHLISMVRGDPVAEHAKALEAIARLGRKTHPTLRELVGEERLPVALDCGRRLLALCGDRALEWIAPAVARTVRAGGLSPDEVSRRTRAALLEGDPALAEPSIPEAIARLGDADPSIARRAAWSLGRIGPRASESIPALEALSHHRRKDLRDAARDALVLIREEGGAR